MCTVVCTNTAVRYYTVEVGDHMWTVHLFPHGVLHATLYTVTDYEIIVAKVKDTGPLGGGDSSLYFDV